jgi:ABC-type phosphate/phosphonate transport system permease subunit
MKRVTISALLCALIFGLLATWLGPRMITYWYTPPVPAGAASAFNCADAVQWAMNKLVLTQVIGSLIGVVVGIVLGILLRPRTAPPPAAPPATKVA